MFQSLSIFLLATTALALPVVRDDSTIESDLRALNADYNALQAADETYAATGNAASVQPAVNQVISETLLATTDTTASPPLTDDDSQNINDYISTTLEPSIKAAIQATVANKAKLQAAGLTTVVQTELALLKTETDALGVALEAKEPSAEQAAAQVVFAKIDADYEKGIEALN